MHLSKSNNMLVELARSCSCCWPSFSLLNTRRSNSWTNLFICWGRVTNLKEGKKCVFWISTIFCVHPWQVCLYTCTTQDDPPSSVTTDQWTYNIQTSYFAYGWAIKSCSVNYTTSRLLESWWAQRHQALLSQICGSIQYFFCHVLDITTDPLSCSTLDIISSPFL